MLNAEIIGEFERQYLSLEANSADEVSQWVSQRHKGFRSSPLEKQQPGPVARFARATVDELSLVNFRWNQAFQSECLEDLNAYFICIPHSGRMKMQTAQNEEIVQTTENLRVFKRTAGLKNTVAAGFSNLSIIVPADLLERRLEGLIDERLREPLKFAPLIDVDEGPGHSLVSFVTHLLSLTNSAPETLGNEILRANIKEHFLSVMFECLPHNYSDAIDNGTTDSLPKSLLRAEEFMRAHCAEPLTLADIAQAAGCSERGLQHAFKSKRNVGPMSVLRDIRLEKARYDLMHTNDSIAEIAYRWGFSNQGRFARVFATKYGEKPSKIETLSRVM
ncbi:MAG: AraC family transcriptional regulator [Rhizobiales bacterium]|nr:AraC family transcriptional regulator [Hyphomicrobiales bacterium]